MGSAVYMGCRLVESETIIQIEHIIVIILILAQAGHLLSHLHRVAKTTHLLRIIIICFGSIFALISHILGSR